MTGKRINEGTISGLPNNARFGASLLTYPCRATNREYVSVFATKNIQSGEEILSHYGDQVQWFYPTTSPDTDDTDTDDKDGGSDKTPKKRPKM